MNVFKTTLLAASATIAMGGAALAQESTSPFDFSFNAGAASDYVFRGVSQTDENPQVFAGVDTSLWGVGYAGAWISNVDFNNDTDAEYDLYVGVKPTVGPFNLDLGVIYYGYINAPSGAPTLALTGGAAERLAEMIPAGHTAHIHLTLTDDHPWAQAFVIIEAIKD